LLKESRGITADAVGLPKWNGTLFQVAISAIRASKVAGDGGGPNSNKGGP
jgi:hypothetical protein